MINFHRRHVCGFPALLLSLLITAPGSAQVLDGASLTKYLDPLPIPGAMPQAAPNHYEIGMWQIQQKLHSQLPLTTVWGYGTSPTTASYPGATIEAVHGVPITVHWTNNLPPEHLLESAIDSTLDMAMPPEGVPVVPHVHGAEVEPRSDGGPNAWFTQGFAEKGPTWSQEIYHYANSQPPATLWYHDHALGITRLNVYAGLAGFYLLRDPGHEPAGLPAGAYEIPIVIQDRMFTTDGQLFYPNVGDNEDHPVWTPEFFGNVILVNGKVWPYLNVEPRRYRFRFLNGSDARFYSLTLADAATDRPGPAFAQIGSDGGYLEHPVLLNDPSNAASPRLVIAPGERADMVIDFAGLSPGTQLILKNTAKAPYPSGDAPDPKTVGQIMLFNVVPASSVDNSLVPATLNTIPKLANPSEVRTMTLNEMEGENGPLGALLNGMEGMAPVTETPTVGSTEMWEIVNLTGDTHPIHIHLIQFQLVNRQPFNARRYENAFELANPAIPADSYNPVSVTPYLRGKPRGPDPNEAGWKDTFRMNPGEVTRIMVRFTSQDGAPFPFDATAQPGYVWHCHILEHEDNQMMRPYVLVNPVLQPALLTAEAPAGTPALALRPAQIASNGAAMIRFTLAREGAVRLNVYNLNGQLVRQLADGAFSPGEHTIAWNGRNGAGIPAASGIYFINLWSQRATATGKLLLTR